MEDLVGTDLQVCPAPSPTAETMLVAGVNGCRGGWLVVSAETGDKLRILGATIAASFGDVLDQTSGCLAVAIDVPIGLMDAGHRVADSEARKLLKSRASCVFPSAIRPVLGITDYYEACHVSFAVQEKRIPKRAFDLGLRSHKVDELMTPELQRRVVEVHPEVCFWALNGGGPLLSPKRTTAGQFDRCELLSRAFEGDLQGQSVPNGAALDDLYDACAATWTACRFARGEHCTLPAHPPIDSRGLRMEIVY